MYKNKPRPSCRTTESWTQGSSRETNKPGPYAHTMRQADCSFTTPSKMSVMERERKNERQKERERKKERVKKKVRKKEKRNRKKVRKKARERKKRSVWRTHTVLLLAPSASVNTVA